MNTIKEIKNNSAKRRTSFVFDALMLVSGTTLSQVLVILTAPIITRLYNPEAFGSSALFTSIAGVIITIACLRYEMAIMLPKKDEEASNLLGLCIISVSIICMLTIPLILLGQSLILQILNAPELGQYLWLIPIAVFWGGVFSALYTWDTRTKHFGSLSAARVVSTMVSTSTQIGVGSAGYTAGGSLIGANIIGSFASTSLLGMQIWREDRRLLTRSINWQGIKNGFRRYKNFPIYDTWGALLNTLSWQLPTFILSSFFSSIVVGYYALGMMVLQLPTNFIGGAISQVFFQRAAEARFDGTLAQLIESTIQRLALIGFFPVLFLSLFGEEIFAVIFGAKWAEAGVYTQILAIAMLFIFVTSPLFTLFSVLEKQGLFLFFNILLCGTRTSALIMGGLLGDVHLALLLFSVVGAIDYAVIGLWLFKAANASIYKMSKKILQQLVYCLPILSVIIIIKWFIPLDPREIILIGSFTSILYYAIVIRHDEEMQLQATNILKKS